MRTTKFVFVSTILALLVVAGSALVIASGLPYEQRFDFNSDGRIDATDTQMIGNTWHRTPSTAGPQYDVTGDGQIDIRDVQAVSARWGAVATSSVPAIVFVSRQIPPDGSVYWAVPNDLPGVGPYSRFRVAKPGKLVVREANGSLRTLIDGANPSAATLNLVDVNAPDVSYDGTKIVFAGLPQGSYDMGPMNNPGAWRLYVINVDGSGLRQVTVSDRNIDLSQFGQTAVFGPYDDTDPVWLPDGRIAFSSTRWPGYGHYSAARISNIYVVNSDGSNLHRITSERNGADRPLVDPVTGKIVYSRWWRNHRMAVNDMSTIYYDPNDPSKGYAQHQGLTIRTRDALGGPFSLDRNFWVATAINPDGTDLAMWGGLLRDQARTHAYGGAFTPSGDLYANYFPMMNMTEAAGFGGVRLMRRGAGSYTPIIGHTLRNNDYVNPANPTSFGIDKGTYAAEPEVLPDGRLVVSWAPDVAQDYGLYLINADGSGRTLLYDNPGTTELRARAIRARPRPPIIPDRVTHVASQLPPREQPPYAIDGTFVFDALNVYFNAPVDTDIVSAPPVGSAAKIRFFLDHQRTSYGSLGYMDWPILLGEMPVNPDGSVRNTSAPADLPLFEQLRAADGTVPQTMGPTGPDGAAHVTGMNFARPGETARCVGCHAGHTMLPVPANDADAKWTNLATGAQVTVSSARDQSRVGGLIDRRVMKGEIWRYWSSAPGQTTNQWVQLTFPVPISVRTVRLYNPRQEGDTDLVVQGTRVRLFSDAAATVQVAEKTTGQVATSGTDVAFNDVRVRAIRVEITGATGRVFGAQAVSLAEIEVIARGEQ